MRAWQETYNNIKDFLFALVNKEFLIFLFFLAVSAFFWLLSSLNDVYERELPVALSVTDVPDRIIITEDLPDTVRVTVRDKGFSLLELMLHDGIPPLKLSFNLYAGKNGKGNVPATDIQKLVRQRLSETASVLSVKAERLDFHYNHGNKKMVPIVLQSVINTRSNHYVTRCALTPDSALVYASDDALDTITAVYTDHLRLDNVEGALSTKVDLLRIHGAKVMPEQTQVNIVTDQLTEVMVSVPIKAVNVPEGVTLRLFPAIVDVRVAVGVKRSATVKAELFNVVADYNDIPRQSAQRLPLKMVSQPKGIVKATMIHPMVDYLIEK